MTKLEGLLREADDRRVRLETRVADAQRLEWALRQRIEELERRLRDLGQNAQPVPQTSAQIPVQQTAVQMTVPQQAMQTMPLPSVGEASAQRVDGDDFAAVLHQSILREQARGTAETMPPVTVQTAASSVVQQNTPAIQPPPMQPVPLSPRSRADAYLRQMPESSGRPHDDAVLTARVQAMQTAEPSAAAPAEEPLPPEDEAIGKARALLRAGRTIEQVARETGVEIGALRLMKQMTARD